MREKHLIVLLITICTSTIFHLVNSQCNPRDLLIKHEGKKECMYLDSKNFKTIGIGFLLTRSDAQSILTSVGANYDEIMKSTPTPVKQSCNCSSNPKSCLTETQINSIFEITIKESVTCAANVGNFCCNVQNVLVDMAFNMGCSKFMEWNTLFSLLKSAKWQGAAEDLIKCNPNYCSQVKSRCDDNAQLLSLGCGCPGLRSCDAASRGCCDQSNTCCWGDFGCSASQKIGMWLCCPLQNAVCCPQNKCCPSNYPVCCPNGCCPAGYRCNGNTCIRATSSLFISDDLTQMNSLENSDVIEMYVVDYSSVN